MERPASAARGAGRQEKRYTPIDDSNTMQYLFLLKAELRHTDILATILAGMSARMSVSVVSWNAAVTARAHVGYR